jgi:hypothetical protein
VCEKVIKKEASEPNPFSFVAATRFRLPGMCAEMSQNVNVSSDGRILAFEFLFQPVAKDQSLCMLPVR